MPLSSLVLAVREQLTAEIPGAPPVSSDAPAVAADLPCVTVSIEGAGTSFRGLGSFPAPAQTGALRVTTTVELADAVLHLAGEDVELLSADRRTLQLPHGAVVRVSGDDTPPFGPADLDVRLGATTFAPVHEAPTGAQVRLDVPSGTLTFADALPPSGTLELTYFVGMWEVRVERFSATVHLDVAAATSASVESLVAAVEAALSPERGVAARGFRAVAPVALSAASPVAALGASARSQRLTYAVDFERIEPVIPSSGGPIAQVDVDSTVDPILSPPFTESFEVT